MGKRMISASPEACIRLRKVVSGWTNNVRCSNPVAKPSLFSNILLLYVTHPLSLMVGDVCGWLLHKVNTHTTAVETQSDDFQWKRSYMTVH